MDEMKLIGEMFAAVPPPSPARLGAVRARVLNEALPPPPGITQRAGDKIRPFTWPRLALTSAIAVAAALGLITAGLTWLGGNTLALPANAAELLHRAAAAALAQPAPTDKQLIYSDTTIYYATYTHRGRLDGHIRVRQQEWQSPVTPTAFYRTSPCDVDGDLRRGQGTCSFEGGYAPGAQPYSTYAGLATLPRGATKLLAYLATLPAPGGLSKYDREWSGANLIASLNPVLPPRFAAALFRAVAQIPGATLQRNATDAAGARGNGISRRAGGMRAELIFDPTTYRLVGQEYLALAHGPGRAAKYVTSATALAQWKFLGTGSHSENTGPNSPFITGPRNNQFIYTDTKIVVLSPISEGARRVIRWTLMKGSEQVWQSADGSRPGAFETAPCELGRTGCLLLIPPGVTATLATYAGLKRLPRQPARLASDLRRYGGCPNTVPVGRGTVRVPESTREWDALTAILGDVQVMPAGLGKVLFTTAATIQGAVVLRSVTDAAGGHGIAVARNEPGALRTELIFAPHSYRFIGVQEVLARGLLRLRAGTVWAASALVAARIVNNAPITSLGQFYTPPTCGFTPGQVGVGSSAAGPSSSSGSSSPTTRSTREP